ncbi:MAG: YceI family protein [Bacteroidota bacterium]|nr:YceI family protein [Bacteroidota bacterium]
MSDGIKKYLLLLIILVSLLLPSYGQKYITRNGYIGFFSHTPIEDIKADNNQVASVLDASTGDLVFQVLVRSFHFVKTLMEEHFNENYMESDKIPKSTFSGKIVNIKDVNFSKPGNYDVTVEGDLMIHGVTKKITEKGSLEVATDGINASSKFILTPEDFNINIPSVVRNNIAKTIEVTVNIKYTPVAGN